MEGLDYKHTFSPVAKLATVGVLITLATAHRQPIHQLDINNAILHDYIVEEIYMHPPEGYSVPTPWLVCCLKRSLDGLKQASCQWNQEFTRFLLSLGYFQSKHDYSLFVKHDGIHITVALVYVDDVLLTGNFFDEITRTKAALDHQFTIKDLGLAKYFLGIEICTTNQGTMLYQRKYIIDILTDSGIFGANSIPSPLRT